MTPAGFLSRVLPAAILVASPLYYAEAGIGGVVVCFIVAALLAAFA